MLDYFGTEVQPAWERMSAGFRESVHYFDNYIKSLEAQGVAESPHRHLELGAPGKLYSLGTLITHAGYFLNVIHPEILLMEEQYGVVVDIGGQYQHEHGVRDPNISTVSLALLRTYPVTTYIRTQFLVSESVESADACIFHMVTVNREIFTQFLNTHRRKK